jgi:hypothetical protein
MIDPVTGKATPTDSMVSGRSIATMRSSPNLAMFTKHLGRKRRFYDLNLETSLGRKIYIILTITLPMIPLIILTVKMSMGLALNVAYDRKMERSDFVNILLRGIDTFNLFQ